MKQTKHTKTKGRSGSWRVRGDFTLAVSEGICLTASQFVGFVGSNCFFGDHDLRRWELIAQRRGGEGRRPPVPAETSASSQDSTPARCGSTSSPFDQPSFAAAVRCMSSIAAVAMPVYSSSEEIVDAGGSIEVSVV